MFYRLCCLFLLAATAVAQVTFKYTSYPTAPGAHSLDSADFNHDGKLDVVIANRRGFSLFLGAPDGTFQPRVDTDTIWYTGDLVVADFNGDGNPDLAVVNWGYFLGTGRSIDIFLGNGDGTFQRPYEYEVGNFPVGLVVGDFNGDGIPDLATTDLYDGKISVLLGRGDGTFQPQRTFSTFTDNPYSPLAADFNGDGITDLLVQNDGSVSLFLGDGHGNFEDRDGDFATPAFYSTKISADVNGDGIADFVIGYTSFPAACWRDCYPSAKYAVWLGGTDGSFQRLAPLPLVWGKAIAGIASADFDGDGKADLAFALSPGEDYGLGSVQTLLGNGDGTFAPGGSLGARELSDPSAMIARDVNQDGKPDLLVLDTALLVFLNTTPWPYSTTTVSKSSSKR